MGKGRPRSVEKGVLGLGQSSSSVSSSGDLNIPSGPVYYPTEEEFKDPLEFIYKIRPEAEPYGICRIVPPKSWKPPFALDLNSFTFPTKTQSIHQLQARSASCDSKTFELEYSRFLEEQCGRKLKKKIVFEGEDLDLCKLFNSVKRYGGYDKVLDEKKWGKVSRVVRPGAKISECAKYVLSQLYREHLYDYEEYYNKLNKGKVKNSKVETHSYRKNQEACDSPGSKRRRKNVEGERVKTSKVEEEELDQICEQCRSGLHGEVMLLCDRCNKGWHIYCLSPPLKDIPPGNWYCLDCLNSDKDSFGFVPGRRFSLEAFRRVADRAKKKWFGLAPTSKVQLEKKFWEIVEGSAGEVDVKYGSDLDTSVYGSGFPRVDGQRPESVDVEKWNEYCASPWNLNNLPKLQGSMLRAVRHGIAGVMVPWLYIGMLFSSFCWHFEDHCFYSMNYLHWGEPKYWYSVPGNQADAFEKVMKNSLPDLFDAQPDLLFQLVTMLNPSVLMENDVPVYSVLQEPGNFVVTFPRSYHGGFNFGLNCAEAVNFAPADWLPHGSFGAELYQLYHKAAVLSHEELLCVVAKGDFDSRTSHYLKKELYMSYNKEKTWRERLWRSGTVNSSPMSPRKHPEYMGSEEDPTCIICQKYLHLSANVCRCRPSTFVCLEHWEHLCECKPKKRRLLYRYTLAELKDLLQMIDKTDSLKTVQDRNSRRQILSSGEPGALTKKVKGGHLTFTQLAEEWLLSSCKILENVYSKEAYVKALKEAEQFLWAGAEMDPVREMTKNLTEAKKWAEDVRACLSRLESWSSNSGCDTNKVQFKHVEELLKFDPVPCDEPALLRLQNFAEEARVLRQEINSALPTCSKISDWEALYSRACALPINIDESGRILQRLSSVKVWQENVQKCLSEKSPAAIEVDILFSLQAEISNLSIDLPEAEKLLCLVRQAEICQDRCNEVLKGSISLKKLETLLADFSDFTINIPQLKLLRQYHSDAISWISRYNDVLVNIHEREDQDNVVSELTCIQKDGELLKVQVDKLSCIELELKKACCRAKVLKALTCKMSLDFIQQLVMEATTLQIEKETCFVNIAGALSAAVNWEARAKHILSNDVQISDFEEAMRTSKDICAILPSLDAVMDALSSAKSWLEKSERFLLSNSAGPSASSCPLRVENLKDLVTQSKLLKMSLREKSLLEVVLDNCMKWENDASSILQCAMCLLNTDKVQDLLACELTSRIEKQVTELESIIDSGLCLGLDFDDIPKLQDTCLILRWCYKCLSLCSGVPQLEEVQAVVDARLHLPVTCASSSLFSLVVDGINWLEKATEITKPCDNRKFKLSDAVDILNHSRNIQLSFKPMATELVRAIQDHKSWTEQVHAFFSLNRGDRSWISLLELQKLGRTSAFNCSELEKVFSEVQKVETWKQRCKDMVGFSVGDPKSLHQCLLEMEQTLDRSLYIYGGSEHCKPSELCLCCSSDVGDSDFLTCSVCKDCYHLQCLGHPVVGTNSTVSFLCHYCQFLDSGKISQTRGGPLKYKGKRADLSKLKELLSESEGFALWIEERDVLNQIVQKALSCKELLTEIADSALTCYDEDLSFSAERLSVATKAVEVAAICYHQGVSKFELAMARNSWRVRANKLLRGSQKPPILQVQRHLKEGTAISLPPEDYFWKSLTEAKLMCMQWAEKAKKVSVDGGAMGLGEVFDLITEGEKLPVHLEKELKLLRDRSMLYCICRKPYDQRAMIACDKCDEWYHFDCIKLHSSPKVYVCPACKLPSEELSSASTITPDKSSSHKCEEPQTPSPGRSELSCKLRRPNNINKSSRDSPPMTTTDDVVNDLRRNSNGGMERLLLWRTRKPFRRVVRKRSQLDSLSLFFNIQQQ